jgi:hypothetical protein
MPPETVPAEVEIGLYRWDAERYAVDLRYTTPEGDGDATFRPTDQVRLDYGGLMARATDPDGYGELLGQCLFADPGIRAAFGRCRAHAATLTDPRGRPLPLRVRLNISPNSPELHSLRWETLRDPADGTHLAASEAVLFSRYLISPDWRPVTSRPSDPAALRVVLAVPSPTDVAKYRLHPIDVLAEVHRARDALPIPNILELSGTAPPMPDGRTRPTLPNILGSLRDGCDLLYLVCHGTIVLGEAVIWLENEEGRSEVVKGVELASCVRELREQPLLVVLASCQSGGIAGPPSTADGGALAALGPRLAEVGIPAVLAMAGDVTMDTVARFMPTFFAELLRDGQIDRAAGVARRACLKDRRHDWWVPALYLRLRNGNLWHHRTPSRTPPAGEPREVLEERLERCRARRRILERNVQWTREKIDSYGGRHHAPLAVLNDLDENQSELEKVLKEIAELEVQL